MRASLSKLGWFVGIWIASVLSLTVIAYLIRLVIAPAVQ